MLCYPTFKSLELGLDFSIALRLHMRFCMQTCLPKYCVEGKVKAKVKRDGDASQDCRVLSGRHCVKINVFGLPR